jgi:hypothetical protein
VIFLRREWVLNRKILLCWSFLLSFLVLFCSPVHFLTIRSADGFLLASYPMRGGEEFAVRYIHSVQKTPVLEVFRLDFREGIELRETVYTDFGAGLPFLLEGYAAFESGGGKFRIYGIKKHLPDIVFRVGRFADYRLLFRERDIPFTQFEKPGKPLHFGGEKGPFIFSFFY